MGAAEMKVSKLLVFTQENCPNCPVAKKAAMMVGDELKIPVEVVDVNEVPDDLEFELLQNQIYVAATPTIVAVEDGRMKPLALGDPISYEELKEKVLEGE